MDNPTTQPTLNGSLIAWESAFAECQRIANELPLLERDAAQNHLDGFATVIRRNFRKAVARQLEAVR